MKSLIGVASFLAVWVSPAFAADGSVSTHSLANMGLAQMTPMSDADGMQVRGLSARVGGFNLASAASGGATSGGANAYYASGSHFAVGGSYSLALTATAAALSAGFATAKQ